MKVVKWIVAVLLVIVLVGTLGSFVALNTMSGRNAAQQEALDALVSDANVTVTQGDQYVFTPTGQTPDTGFIIYPGGLVDPVAYAPTARDLAELGYLVILDKAPLDLAVIDPGAASDIMAAHPDIEAWAIGGHSLGGAMAADFIARNPGVMDGLALWAAYPAGNRDLSGFNDLQVVSVSGSNDGLATPADIEDSRSRLPANTTFVVIEGGNHTQFGSYGEELQSGDNPATISPEDQRAQTVAATAAMLEAIDPTP